MSAISSRPRVRSVAATAAPIAALLAARVFSAAWRSLGATAKQAYRRAVAVVPPEAAHVPQALPAVPAFRHSFTLPENLTPIEKVQVSTLLAIATTPCMVESAGGLQQQLESLRRSRSLDEVKGAQRALFESLTMSHHNLFQQSIGEVCAKAAVEVGFSQVEFDRARPGELRIIATDPAGRSLVSEISAVPDGEASLATEVVGVHDGSCNQILDRFDTALGQLGVYGGAPSRKSTGGVCELAAARDLLRKKALGAVRRTQRLNQPVTERNKV
jgi:hypothetical protein